MEKKKKSKPTIGRKKKTVGAPKSKRIFTPSS